MEDGLVSYMASPGSGEWEHSLILLLFRMADRAPAQPQAQTAKELCLTIGGALGPMGSMSVDVPWVYQVTGATPFM